MSNWRLPKLAAEVELYVEPPAADFNLFSVGTSSPTEDDVRAASDALVAAEVELQTVPDLILQMQDTQRRVSLEYERSTSSDEDRLIYADAITRISHLLSNWMSYLTILSDYVSRLRSQIAVMEHDIQWQAYIAAEYGQTEFDREVRADNSNEVTA